MIETSIQLCRPYSWGGFCEWILGMGYRGASEKMASHVNDETNINGSRIMNINGRYSLVLFLALYLSSVGCGYAFPSKGPDGEPVVETKDEPLHHVIYETKDVRVMRVLLLPGVRTMWHEQHLDYVNTHISGSPVKVEYIGQPVKYAVMETGHIRFGPHQGKSEVDRITNTGTTLNHQIAFEIKKNGPQSFGAGDRSDVKGFKLALDKPTVYGWHVELKPGESTGVYTVKGPGVRVVFKGNRIISTKKNSTVTQITTQDGDAFLIDPGTYVITNGGSEDLVFNEYEVK